MKKLSFFVCLCCLIACSPVKTPLSIQHQLSSYSSQLKAKHPKVVSILVTVPEATAGYQTEQMRYIKRPYTLEAFSKNTWVNPPASMLYPLLVQSLQKSGYFKAVLSSGYSEPIDYRIDTQLLRIQQNFIKRPSVLEFSAKVALTEAANNQVKASHIFNLEIPCPQDTPYGGVIAANKASAIFTAQVTDFIIKHT
jgi:cholesterol transport system auxiliary component